MPDRPADSVGIKCDWKTDIYFLRQILNSKFGALHVQDEVSLRSPQRSSSYRARSNKAATRTYISQRFCFFVRTATNRFLSRTWSAWSRAIVRNRPIRLSLTRVFAAWKQTIVSMKILQGKIEDLLYSVSTRLAWIVFQLWYFEVCDLERISCAAYRIWARQQASLSRIVVSAWRGRVLSISQERSIAHARMLRAVVVNWNLWVYLRKARSVRLRGGKHCFMVRAIQDLLVQPLGRFYSKRVVPTVFLRWSDSLVQSALLSSCWSRWRESTRRGTPNGEQRTALPGLTQAHLLSTAVHCWQLETHRAKAVQWQMERVKAEREAADARRSNQGLDDARAQVHRTGIFTLALLDHHDELSAQLQALPQPAQQPAHAQSEAGRSPLHRDGDDKIVPVLRDMLAQARRREDALRAERDAQQQRADALRDEAALFCARGSALALELRAARDALKTGLRLRDEEAEAVRAHSLRALESDARVARSFFHAWSRIRELEGEVALLRGKAAAMGNIFHELIDICDQAQRRLTSQPVAGEAGQETIGGRGRGNDALNDAIRLLRQRSSSPVVPKPTRTGVCKGGAAAGAVRPSRFREEPAVPGLARAAFLCSSGPGGGSSEDSAAPYMDENLASASRVTKPAASTVRRLLPLPPAQDGAQTRNGSPSKLTDAAPPGGGKPDSCPIGTPSGCCAAPLAEEPAAATAVVAAATVAAESDRQLRASETVGASAAIRARMPEGAAPPPLPRNLDALRLPVGGGTQCQQPGPQAPRPRTWGEAAEALLALWGPGPRGGLGGADESESALSVDVEQGSNADASAGTASLAEAVNAAAITIATCARAEDAATATTLNAAPSSPSSSVIAAPDAIKAPAAAVAGGGKFGRAVASAVEVPRSSGDAATSRNECVGAGAGAGAGTSTSASGSVCIESPFETGRRGKVGGLYSTQADHDGLSRRLLFPSTPPSPGAATTAHSPPTGRRPSPLHRLGRKHSESSTDRLPGPWPASAPTSPAAGAGSAPAAPAPAPAAAGCGAKSPLTVPLATWRPLLLSRTGQSAVTALPATTTSATLNYGFQASHSSPRQEWSPAWSENAAMTKDWRGAGRRFSSAGGGGASVASEPLAAACWSATPASDTFGSVDSPCQSTISALKLGAVQAQSFPGGGWSDVAPTSPRFECMCGLVLSPRSQERVCSSTELLDLASIWQVCLC